MSSRDEHSWSTNSKRVLTIQALTVVGVLLLNALAQSYLSSHPVTITRALVYKKWQLLLSQTEPADIIIMGDSSAAFSINPDKLSKKSGLKVKNFSTVGDLLALDDAWAFNHYVKNVGSPRILVIMRYVPFWELENPSALLQATIPLPWKYWERMEPGVRTSGPHNLNYLLAKFFPLYQRSYSVKKLLRFWRRGLEVESVTPNGSLNLKVGPDWAFIDNKALPERLKLTHPFFPSELNLFALDSIQKTCERSGTTLILVNPPIYREDAKLNRYREYIEQQKAALNQYANSHPNVFFLMQDPILLDKSELFDSIHPNEKGSDQITESLHLALSGKSAQNGAKSGSPEPE